MCSYAVRQTKQQQFDLLPWPETVAAGFMNSGSQSVHTPYKTPGFCKIEVIKTISSFNLTHMLFNCVTNLLGEKYKNYNDQFATPTGFSLLG